MQGVCVRYICNEKCKGNWTQIYLGLKDFKPSRLMQPAAILET